MRRWTFGMVLGALAGCSAPGVQVLDVDLRERFAASVPGRPSPAMFAPIPGGTVEGVDVEPFYLAVHEVTWAEFEAWMDDAEAVAATTKPSRPYISIDRGFGRGAHPALSVSFESARGYVAWLSEQTGHPYRLPTEDELRLALAAGRTRGVDLDGEAWHGANADGRTHPVGTKAPAPSGVFDLLGNVAEWCLDSAGEPGLFGGSYRNDPDDLRGPLQRADASWNRSDPQLPKSRWWFADASFPGLRVATDAAPSS